MKISKTGFKVAAALTVIVIGVIVWIFPQETYEIKNHPLERTNVIVFGNSLVEGVGASEGHDFVSLLSRRTGMSIVNAGRSGDTTGMALKRLESEVLSKNPGVVLVLLGGNDFLRGIPKTETFKNLSLIVDRIQNEGAVVVLLGIQGGLFQDDYRRDFTRLAREKGAAYIPNVLKGILGRADLLSDSVHPNDDGYKIIADRVTPVLEDLLR